MSEADPTQQLRTTIAEHAGAIDRFDIAGTAEIAKHKGFGDVDVFEKHADALQRTAPDLVRAAHVTERVWLLEEIVGWLLNVKSRLEDIRGAFQITDLNAAKSTWAEKRSQVGHLAQPTESSPNGVAITQARLLISYTLATANQYVDVAAEMEAAAANVTVVRQLKDEAEKLLVELRKSLGDGTMLARAKEFDDAAKRADLLSWLFLAGAVVVVALAVCIMVDRVPLFPPPYSVIGYWIPALTQRLVVVSLITSAAVLAARAFRAQRHLHEVNAHRARVLRSYVLITQDAPDAETKAMMLRAAADSIFQGGTSGFLGEGETKTNDQVMALLRDIVSAHAKKVVG